MATSWSLVLLLVALVNALVARTANAQPVFDDYWTISSANGELKVLLVDELSNTTAAGTTVELRVWNQSFTAPLLKCKRGDLISIYLVNKLDQETNLHFHGFHVSPQIPADDAQFKIGNNGKTKLYQFRIPDNHPQGLFWYHSHAMPDSEYQIVNGMSGPFIIEGLLDEVPQLAALPEKFIMLRDIQLDENNKLPAQDIFVGEAPTIRLVNNQIFPNLTCPMGETQLWSVANIGAGISYLLAWERADGTLATEITMTLIARDGITMSHSTAITEPYLIGPAQRAQIVVQCPSSPISGLKLVTRDWTNGLDDFPYTDLINIEVTGVPTAPTFDLNTLNLVPTYKDYRNSNLTRTRTIFFTQVIEGEGGEEEEEEGSFFINSKPFQKGRLDVRTFLGSIEKWVIINTSPEAHYFHIHQGHFQVVSVNGVAQPFYGYVDTVFLPIPTDITTGTTVEIIIPFDNPLQVGKFPYHCHIEAHADGGMMAMLEVIASPDVDVVFVAIAIPILAITFLISALYLAYQWRAEVKARESEASGKSVAADGVANAV